MDPELFSLPDDGEDFSPRRRRLFPALQEDRDVCEMSDRPLQTTGQSRPPGAAELSLSPSTVAGMCCNPDQRCRPDVCPSPFHTPPPRVQLVPPCFPQGWLIPVTFMPDSRVGFSPPVFEPVSGPMLLCCSLCLLPRCRLLVPEVRPSWCSCPQALPVLPCSPHLVSRRRAQQVREQVSVTSGREQTQQQAKTEAEDTKEYKLQANEDCLDSQNQTDNVENSNSFLEYMDELCSDEAFVAQVESTLNIEYLQSLLSSDAEPIDLLALEKQEQETSEVTQQQETSHPSSADSIVAPVTEETSPGTLHVGETAPLRRAQAPVLDPPGSQSNPNHDGQNAPQRNIERKGGRTTCSPLLPSHLLEEQRPTDNSVVASSPLSHDGSLFLNYITPPLQSFANFPPDTSFTLEARHNDVFVEVPAATGDESEEALTSLSNLGDSQSAQTTQKLQEGLLHWDPPTSESPSTSGVSNEDPRTISIKDPEPSFRDDLLIISPPAPTLQVLKALPHPLPPITEPEEQRSANNPSSEVRAGERGQRERERKAVAATNAGEESMTKNTFKCKGENKETKLKGATNVRRSLRLSGQIKFKTRGQERTTSEKSAAKFTPARVCEKRKRRFSGRRQLFKREESNFKERSQATKAANTAEQFSEAGEKLAGEMQTLEVEGGEQPEDNVSTETGAENVTKIPQEEKELGGRQEERIQMSSFLQRTRSTTTQDKVQPRRKISGTERSEIKLPVSSPMKRSREKANDADSTGCKTSQDKVLPESPLQSPMVQTDTRSIKDSIKESRNESPSVKTYEKDSDLTPALGPEIQKQSKPGALSRGGDDGQHSEVTGTKTLDFYSLRSHNVSKRSNERGASEESETRVSETDEEGIETEIIISSPMKRGRWKSRAAANAQRDEEQKLAVNEKDEAETSVCKPSTTSSTKISNASAGRDASSVIKTRTRRRKARSPCFLCKRRKPTLPTQVKRLRRKNAEKWEEDS